MRKLIYMLKPILVISTLKINFDTKYSNIILHTNHFCFDASKHKSLYVKLNFNQNQFYKINSTKINSRYRTTKHTRKWERWFMSAMCWEKKMKGLIKGGWLFWEFGDVVKVVWELWRWFLWFIYCLRVGNLDDDVAEWGKLGDGVMWWIIRCVLLVFQFSEFLWRCMRLVVTIRLAASIKSIKWVRKLLVS